MPESPCQQVIIFQELISLVLPVVVEATYTIQLSIVGINGLTGFGSWTTDFQGNLNDQGLPINSEATLVGNGRYYGSRNNSINSLLAHLKIKTTFPSQLPLETPEPTEMSWKGIITLTSGSVMGLLNSLDGNQVLNVRGYYRQEYKEDSLELFVIGVKIF